MAKHRWVECKVCGSVLEFELVEHADGAECIKVQRCPYCQPTVGELAVEVLDGHYKTNNKVNSKPYTYRWGRPAVISADVDAAVETPTE